MAITYAVTFDKIPTPIADYREAVGYLNLAGTYATGGFAVTPADFGMSQVLSLVFESYEGRDFQYDEATGKVVATEKGAFTPAGTNANESAHTHTLTGTLPTTALDLATPRFSGTGLTAAGQVITTTDNQTMTLNQCAGMWLISATGATPPNLILSNTAVTGAPAVLTVQGSANTDAGAYKIVASLAPVGTIGAGTAHTHTFSGTVSAAGAMSEVAASTDLSAVNRLNFVVKGI